MQNCRWSFAIRSFFSSRPFSSSFWCSFRYAILVIDTPDLDLLYQVIKSGNLPYFSATAIVCSHIFALAFTQFQSQLKGPPFPGVAQ